jgi:hypothetical protein
MPIGYPEARVVFRGARPPRRQGQDWLVVTGVAERVEPEELEDPLLLLEPEELLDADDDELVPELPLDPELVVAAEAGDDVLAAATTAAARFAALRAAAFFCALTRARASVRSRAFNRRARSRSAAVRIAERRSARTSADPLAVPWTTPIDCVSTAGDPSAGSRPSVMRT